MQGFAKNMALEAGLDITDRKITNTSFRVSSFHALENLAVDAQSGQAFSGHVRPQTAAIYRRKNVKKANAIGIW